LHLYGPNGLVEEPHFATLVSSLRFFVNPLAPILLVASAISLALGDELSADGRCQRLKGSFSPVGDTLQAPV
jgi:magnesium-transporting ATPase (P-type)